MDDRPGPILLFGSGETSPQGRTAYEWLFRRLATPPRVAVLETPAGFEPNSARVAGRLADFIRHRLQNYRPTVDVIAARRRGTSFSPDEPAVVEPLLRSDVIALGAGSPTYAIRQLEGSLAWHYLIARHHRGAAIVLASAATIATSRSALPVYEIYKVGDDPFWRTGLDLLGRVGLRLALVPHWNNTEGGDDLDTSRCFMGRERFARLVAALPDQTTIVGIDERTALAIDLAAGSGFVLGRGAVTVVRAGAEVSYPAGTSLPLTDLGPFHWPPTRPAIPGHVWEIVDREIAARTDEPAVPNDVATLLEERTRARSERDWARADELRRQIEESGWQVTDGRDGSTVSPITPR